MHQARERKHPHVRGVFGLLLSLPHTGVAGARAFILRASKIPVKRLGRNLQKSTLSGGKSCRKGTPFGLRWRKTGRKTGRGGKRDRSGIVKMGMTKGVPIPETEPPAPFCVLAPSLAGPLSPQAHRSRPAGRRAANDASSRASSHRTRPASGCPVGVGDVERASSSFRPSPAPSPQSRRTRFFAVRIFAAIGGGVTALLTVICIAAPDCKLIQLRRDVLHVGRGTNLSRGETLCCLTILGIEHDPPISRQGVKAPSGRRLLLLPSSLRLCVRLSRIARVHCYRR